MKSEKDICERACRFSLRIVKMCQVLEKRSGVGRMFSQQAFRSGTSIGANLEEAQAAQSRSDFISKVSIALKEARETHYWLRLITQSEILKSELLIDITNECNEIISILTSIVKRAKHIL